MKTGFTIFCVLMFSAAQAWGYEKNLRRWEEFPRPKDKRSGDAMVWFYAANYSRYEWRVFMKDLLPLAELKEDHGQTEGTVPPFPTTAGEFRKGHTFCKVEGGWLVGFNRGEWGGALYWFSNDGSKNYKISDHQIQAFLQTPHEIIAIEGLAHLDLSEGSVIKVRQNSSWKAETLITLPQAPTAGAVLRDGSLLLVLSDSLIIWSKNAGLKTLISDADWGSLYPNSIVVSKDENTAFIGMRQFVAEYDFKAGLLRFLIPDKSFLNHLGKEKEKEIRRQYGG